ncbi:hypothetical protein Bbelb_016040 [Branchiostoma belcheri]|nr:hypothetical protein Bbelb_016040 [Branchiostoma belcheri]
MASIAIWKRCLGGKPWHNVGRMFRHVPGTTRNRTRVSRFIVDCSNHYTTRRHITTPPDATFTTRRHMKLRSVFISFMTRDGGRYRLPTTFDPVLTSQLAKSHVSVALGS